MITKQGDNYILTMVQGDYEVINVSLKENGVPRKFAEDDYIKLSVRQRGYSSNIIEKNCYVTGPEGSIDWYTIQVDIDPEETKNVTVNYQGFIWELTLVTKGGLGIIKTIVPRSTFNLIERVRVTNGDVIASE